MLVRLGFSIQFDVLLNQTSAKQSFKLLIGDEDSTTEENSVTDSRKAWSERRVFASTLTN